jgi:formyltetrahydrofolate deformylase
LRLHCNDRPGVVAKVATALGESGCNIEEASQFNDHLSGQFFMRVVFTPLEKGADKEFRTNFAEIAENFATNWQISRANQKIPTLIMVSKLDHCLNDLLYRWRTDSLNIDITGVVSNHEDCRQLAEDRGVNYYHLPVSSDAQSKKDQEARLREIIEAKNGPSKKSELIVLARYMQVLSDEMCSDYEGKIINIHHSFLPGFKGGKPYHQAYERGVKIIGATAHFATTDLDEGPIIEQDTVRVDHSHTPEKMQAIGRDTEAKVLANSIKMFTEQRIFLHGHRTVVL